MIYITGDTHGSTDVKRLESNMYLKQHNIEFSEGDHLIVAGDFGFPFSPYDVIEFEATGGTKGKYSRYMKWFEKQPYTLLFVDGNHDNHDWWGAQEVSEMFGGRVQINPHCPKVIHLMRGEIYTIEGKTVFTFGGAASIDKAWRTEGVSWWRGEEASRRETEYAFDNLSKHGNKVDHIITHTLPKSLIQKANPDFKTFPCYTADFLDEVLKTVEYKSWYCGHFHVDQVLPDERINILYMNICPLI